MSEPEVNAAFKGAKDLKRFSFSEPGRPHTIEDTLKYVRGLEGQPSEKIAEYVTAFAEKSSEMRALDERCPLILRTSRVPSFPNTVIELARAIPIDRDGSNKTRAAFISTQLARSVTFQHHVKEFGLDKLPVQIAGQPSALWTIHRAFRSLDESGQNSLVFSLGPKLPGRGRLDMANALVDFHAAPVSLRAAELESAPT